MRSQPQQIITRLWVAKRATRAGWFLLMSTNTHFERLCGYQNMGFVAISRTVDMETRNWKISVVVHSASDIDHGSEITGSLGQEHQTARPARWNLSDRGSRTAAPRTWGDRRRAVHLPLPHYRTGRRNVGPGPGFWPARGPPPQGIQAPHATWQEMCVALACTRCDMGATTKGTGGFGIHVRYSPNAQWTMYTPAPIAAAPDRQPPAGAPARIGTACDRRHSTRMRACAFQGTHVHV